MGRPKLTRAYSNVNRQKKLGETRRHAISTLVELLVEQKGGTVTFEQISARSGISVRTIFRLFKDKESLHREMDEFLLSYLQEGTSQIERLKVPGFGRYAFELFDRYDHLLMAYLYSPFGQELRALFRKKLNLALANRIVEDKKIKLTKENRHRLALIVSLVNAKIWHDIKIDTGYSGAEMGPAIEWALTTLIQNL